jgi:NNP family nitrate/nitrite transporter-like MFS transporter
MADYLRVLSNHDALWFMFFYAVSFGGFVALASYLTVYFAVQFGLPAVTAGYCAAICCCVGSVFRPLGVRFAERLGGIRGLAVLYAGAGILPLLAAFAPLTAAFAVLVFCGAMLALGMANGAVFQVVPQRFRQEVGEMTAMIGMAGAVGGFVLAAALGYSRDLTGGYQAGLLMFAGCALIALIGLYIVKTRWKSLWRAAAA